MGKNAGTVFDGKRRRAVESRLKDGYPLSTILAAIDGCKVSPFNQGENDRHQKYDDLELICRDAKHVEDFAAIAEGRPPGRGGGKRHGITEADNEIFRTTIGEIKL